MKYFIFVFLLLSSFLGAAPYNQVLVTVAPHQGFVERIAGDQVKAVLVVPEGASSHTYEPSPRQMLGLSQSDAWFQLGETFEPRAAKALLMQNPQMRLIDMRQDVNLIKDVACACAHHASNDPHYWLSPKEAKIQAQTITKILAELYPEKASLFENNLNGLLQELTDLDHELSAILEPLKTRVVMVAHPAYAYLARDYGLTQLSIETEGRDPTPRQLTNILEKAQCLKVTKLFTQKQYSDKGARLIAKQLNIKIVVLDPYAKDYFSAMRYIGKQFAESYSP